jgi:UDP-glucose 4-epimerase
MTFRNVLVTGGLGHIGSRLIRELADSEGVRVIRIVDNLSTQRYSSLFGLPRGVSYEFLEGDIRKSGDLDRAMNGIDVVFHLAAITDAPSTISTPELTKEVNLDGTRKVVKSAIRNKVKRIIYPSTTSVYGGSKGLVTEKAKGLSPATPYARYKLAGERVVISAAKNHQIEGVVLRLGTIFGASIGMRFHTAVNKFAFQACMGIPLTVWEDALDQVRPYLDLGDCISALRFASSKGMGNGEVYNVLTGNYTVRQIVTAIKTIVPSLSIVISKSPILNQASYHVDDSKIRALGFEPHGDLERSVGETIELLSAFTHGAKASSP